MKLHQNSEIRKQKEEIQVINEELKQQQEELQSQSEMLVATNNLLETKNIQITDSIHYAKTIQNAIHPSVQYIKSYLPDFFLLYRPKDIVSGDFYWFHTFENKIFFAVADCNGHGVPGAFMSLIGNLLLNEIVKEKHIYSLNNLSMDDQQQRLIMEFDGWKGKENQIDDVLVVGLQIH